VTAARWTKTGGSWTREATEVYEAPLDVVWLLHANHMTPSVLDGAGCDFDGPGSQTNGAMAPGQECIVRPRAARKTFRYVVTGVDASAPSVERVETRGPFRRWRRFSALADAPSGTSVTERLTIERGLAFMLERRVVERDAAARTSSIKSWLSSPESERPPFPKNAKPPKLRRS
jgi:hypothetical protein